MRALIAEDDSTCRRLLEKILSNAGNEVVTAVDGLEAYELLQSQNFDVLVTDWMMPRMDGIELVKRARASVKPSPPILMVTALTHNDAREHALGAGADDYLAKPIHPAEVLARVDACVLRSRQEAPPRRAAVPAPKSRPRSVQPPFVGVGIAASTGGPPALVKLFEGFRGELPAAMFVVLHAPSWVLSTFADRLQRACSFLRIRLAEDGLRAGPGEVYIAPGDRHLAVARGSLRLKILDTPPENFVRPAADPLFRSIGEAFGRFGVAAVLTGMGRDGSRGAECVHDAGGAVVIQDPFEAVASGMPGTVRRLGIADQVATLDDLSSVLSLRIGQLAKQLGASRPTRR